MTAEIKSFDCALEALAIHLHDMSGALHVMQFCADELESMESLPAQKAYFERLTKSAHEISLQMKQLKEWIKAYQQQRDEPSLWHLFELVRGYSQLMNRKGHPEMAWDAPRERFEQISLPFSADFQLGLFVGLHLLFAHYASGPTIKVEYEQSNDQTVLKFFVVLAEDWKGFYPKLLKAEDSRGLFQQLKKYALEILNNVYLGKIENCYLECMTNKTKQLCIYFASNGE